MIMFFENEGQVQVIRNFCIGSATKVRYFNRLWTYFVTRFPALVAGIA